MALLFLQKSQKSSQLIHADNTIPVLVGCFKKLLFLLDKVEKNIKKKDQNLQDHILYYKFQMCRFEGPGFQFKSLFQNPFKMQFQSMTNFKLENSKGRQLLEIRLSWITQVKIQVSNSSEKNLKLFPSMKRSYYEMEHKINISHSNLVSSQLIAKRVN